MSPIPAEVIAKLKETMTTTPHDKKNFPATNQAHNCWQRYNEYVLCLKKTSGDEEQCKPMWQLAHSICPNSWTDMWAEQRTKGNFLGVQEHAPAADESHH